MTASDSQVESVVTLFELVLDADEQTARDCLKILTARLQGKEIESQQAEALRERLAPRLNKIIADPEHVLRLDAALLAAAWKSESALQVVREVFAAPSADAGRRISALTALVAAGDPSVLDAVSEVLANSESPAEFRGRVLDALVRLNDEKVAKVVLGHLSQLGPEIRPRAFELLTQRPEWSKPLLASIAAKQIDKDALNMNQLRRVASFKDEELQKQFVALYGTIREGRNPNREQVYWKMRDFLGGTPGDPQAGVAVFKKVCAQCHKMYGEGAEVGPDITRNGRSNWDQLLQNVFDPSAVIGPGFQARIVATTDGRILTGLPVEESDQRIVLKIQGGKLETIPRDQIDEYKVSELSMMPEELEKLVTPQELADLMAYLALDKPPTDPEAKILSGAPMQKQR